MSKNTLRVLHILEAVFNGGVENLLANLHDSINSSEISSDIAFHNNKNVCLEAVPVLTKRWTNLIPIPSFFTINFVPYRKWWKNFINTHEPYDIVHIHYIDSAFCYVDLFKKQGTKIIFHSHNTLPMSIGAQFSKFLSLPSRFQGDYFLGCSIMAGRIRFGKKLCNSKKFSVFINGINPNKFSFDKEKRNDIRNHYDANNKIIVGHIGRFASQKNHKRILEIFHDFHAVHKNSELWLLGKGELFNEIEQYCNKLNLTKSVRFLGNQDNPNDYLNGMDIFLFPSIFEGFGIVLIEAQCSGLPCIVSETIQPEVDIHQNLICYSSLSNSNEEWIKKIETALAIKREDKSKLIEQSCYNIQNSAKELCKIYARVLNIQE